MTIEYFEPRPPRVAAMQIKASWSVGEAMEKLSAFPGVREVSVTTQGRIGDVDRFLYKVEMYKLDGVVPEPIHISGNADGRWLVAVITQHPDADAVGCIRRRVEVKKISTDALMQCYQPVQDAFATT